MQADCRLRGGDFESLRKLKVRKEINNQSSAFRKRKVCLSKFERESRKLECLVNYHKAGRG